MVNGLFSKRARLVPTVCRYVISPQSTVNFGLERVVFGHAFKRCRIVTGCGGRPYEAGQRHLRSRRTRGGTCGLRSDLAGAGDVLHKSDAICTNLQRPGKTVSSGGCAKPYLVDSSGRCACGVWNAAYLCCHLIRPSLDVNNPSPFR